MFFQTEGFGYYHKLRTMYVRPQYTKLVAKCGEQKKCWNGYNLHTEVPPSNKGMCPNC